MNVKASNERVCRAAAGLPFTFPALRIVSSLVLRRVVGAEEPNVVSNIALFYPTPLLEIFLFFLISYYTIKTIDDWNWGISNDRWKLV